MKSSLEIRLSGYTRILFERPVDTLSEAERIVERFFADGAITDGIEFVYVTYDEDFNEVDVVSL